MREHEYRGKRKADGKWVYGFYYKKCGRHIILGDIMPDSDMQREIEVIPETVGEYTGLPDKNGVKIFEGDIIKVTAISTGEYCGRGAVVFEDGNFGIYFCEECEKNEYGAGIILVSGLTYKPYDNQVEVIGNSHDNPELLEAIDEN